MTRRNLVGVVSAAVLAVSVCLVGGVTSTAGAVSTSEYATFTNGGLTGTLSFTDLFPDASIVSQRPIAGPSTSAVLSASTPFGQTFGSSAGQQYLRFSSPSGAGGTSTTTIQFSAPTPATTWGFTLGDVDAESVTVTAIGGDGVPLTAAELGFNGSFNYAGQVDVPTWDAATSTLVGNTADTQGASGWFSPTRPVSTITLTSTTLSGSPEYQLWVAAVLSPPDPTTTPTTGAPDPTTATAASDVVGPAFTG